MKRKLSISIEEKLLEIIGRLVDTGEFRNKSHVVEYTLNKFIYENGR